jgi:hypothetical protein
VVARIFHTGRRTTVGERVADALSKGKFSEVEADMPGAVDVTYRCSKVLSRWIHDPRVDRALGRRCLQEVAARADVFLGRDYVLDLGELLDDKLLEAGEGKE